MAAKQEVSFWDKYMGQEWCTLKTAFTKTGISGLTDSVAEYINAWRDTEIKSALTGESGVGKSTFINTIRGLNSDSEGGAPTGGTETTTEIDPYPHPSNPNFLLVDMPGIGTKKFPKENYLERIDFQCFDFFIIVSTSAFSENDIWLAKEIEAKGRQFFFVRTKFGNDLQNEQMRRKGKKALNSSEQMALKKKVLDTLRKNLKGLKCHDNIFVIDNFRRTEFDFPELEKRLKLNTIKKEAMILTLQAVTEEAIIEKRKVLEERIWQTAFRAAFAIRINSANIAILQKEKQFYLEQFNLDANSLKYDARLVNITNDNLSELLENPSSKEDITQEKMCEDELSKLLPFVPIANNIKTYRIGKKYLTDALNSIAKSAIEVNKKMATGIAEKCEN